MARTKKVMKRLLIILTLSLVSCDNKFGVELIIHNESTQTIDSLRVSTSDKMSTIKLTDIKKGQEKKDFLDMSETVQADGHYTMELNTKRATKTKNIGYYTNGIPLDERIDIFVTDDSIKYTTKISKY